MHRTLDDLPASYIKTKFTKWVRQKSQSLKYRYWSSNSERNFLKEIKSKCLREWKTVIGQKQYKNHLVPRSAGTYLEVCDWKNDRRTKPVLVLSRQKNPIEQLKKLLETTLPKGLHFELMFSRNGKREKNFRANWQLRASTKSWTNHSDVSTLRFFYENKQGDDCEPDNFKVMMTALDRHLKGKG